MEVWYGETRSHANTKKCLIILLISFYGLVCKKIRYLLIDVSMITEILCPKALHILLNEHQFYGTIKYGSIQQFYFKYNCVFHAQNGVFSGSFQRNLNIINAT